MLVTPFSWLQFKWVSSSPRFQSGIIADMEVAGLT